VITTLLEHPSFSVAESVRCQSKTSRSRKCVRTEESREEREAASADTSAAGTSELSTRAAPAERRSRTPVKRKAQDVVQRNVLNSGRRAVAARGGRRTGTHGAQATTKRAPAERSSRTPVTREAQYVVQRNVLDSGRRGVAARGGRRTGARGDQATTERSPNSCGVSVTESARRVAFVRNNKKRKTDVRDVAESSRRQVGSHVCVITRRGSPVCEMWRKAQDVTWSNRICVWRR
jgi:hypothetical protein